MNELSKAEEFARIAFTAHYEAAHGEGGQLAWARLGDGERQLWLEAGEAVEERVAGSDHAAEIKRLRGAVSDLLDNTGIDDGERARWLEHAGIRL